MAGRIYRKPFSVTGAKPGPFEEELNALPRTIKEFVLPLLSTVSEQDELHDLIQCCYETIGGNGRFSKRKASQIIHMMKEKQRRERYTLYNPYRNISLNQCIGESKTPVSEWLNITDWKEWE